MAEDTLPQRVLHVGGLATSLLYAQPTDSCVSTAGTLGILRGSAPFRRDHHLAGEEEEGEEVDTEVWAIEVQATVEDSERKRDR